MDKVDRKLLEEVRQILKKAGIANYEKESKWLADFADNPQKLLKYAEVRATHYPLQYILGEWDFYDLTLKIGEGVLIPRPETEILVDKVIEKVLPFKLTTVLDLCTGSGAIAFALEKHLLNVEITAVDYSDKALKWAMLNKEYLGSEVEFLKLNVLDETLDMKFDIITCNPPYLSSSDMSELQEELKYEPTLALNGLDNDDGLEYYRKISKNWKKCLVPGGRIFFEIGAMQAEDIEKVLTDNGYDDIEIFQDYSGCSRVITGVCKM
jgi:release factor glutamine methyltransferase